MCRNNFLKFKNIFLTFIFCQISLYFIKLMTLSLKMSNDIFNCPYLEQDLKFRIKYVIIEKSGTKVTRDSNYRDC